MYVVLLVRHSFLTEATKHIITHNCAWHSMWITFILCFFYYIHFIIHGLLNLRIGTTSINFESSRSHTYIHAYTSITPTQVFSSRNTLKWLAMAKSLSLFIIEVTTRHTIKQFNKTWLEDEHPITKWTLDWLGNDNFKSRMITYS